VREIAASLEALKGHVYNWSQPCPWTGLIQPAGSPVAIARTSLGLQISASCSYTPSGVFQHFALSLTGRDSAGATNALARQILLLKHADGELIHGENGILHLLIHPNGRQEQIFR
jgi:hypothetical protein